MDILDREIHTKPVTERRREPRFPFPAVVQYVMDNESCADLQRGVVINISDNGACLYIYRDSSGGVMGFKDKLPVTADKAAIIWVREVDNSLYKAGVSFLK